MIVIALNTHTDIAQELIDIRVACHPIRLLAGCDAHSKLPQPLITPASMLPINVLNALKDKELLDYGLQVKNNRFEANVDHCILPNSLVISYALAILVSGGAKRILLAGFDGYSADDLRGKEIDSIFNIYLADPSNCPILSITSTRYEIPVTSVYALGNI